MRERLPLLAAATVLPALFALACASGSPRTPQPGERQSVASLQVREHGPILNLRTSDDVAVVHDTVSGRPADLFTLLPTVYESLDVPVSTLDEEAKTLGVLEVRARGEFAGERISRWLDCGTSITGDVAGQRDVYVTLLTQVESLEGTGGSGVSVHLSGYAVQSGQGHQRNCRTRGRLERRIITFLRDLGRTTGG